MILFFTIYIYFSNGSSWVLVDCWFYRDRLCLRSTTGIIIPSSTGVWRRVMGREDEDEKGHMEGLRWVPSNLVVFLFFFLPLILFYLLGCRAGVMLWVSID